MALAGAAMAAVPFIVGTTGNTGPGGDFFRSVVQQVITASGNFVLPAGTHIVIPDSNGQVQVNKGTAGTPSWVAVGAAGNGGFYATDGELLRVLDTSGSLSSTLYYIPMK